MLSELVHRGFRNLADGSWVPGAGGHHLLVGPNGAGKTSLLEAVYVLATCKSFRAARIADCCRHGEIGLGLCGRLGGGERAELELEWGPDGLRRRLNGKPAALDDYLGALPVVAWSGSDGRLIDGGPEQRRRFLDQGVVALRPAALAVLGRYRRALDQKRRLLREGGRGLGAWNQVLATAAGELIAQRRSYAMELETAFGALGREIDLDLPPLELRYRPSPAGDVAAPADLLAAFTTLASRERAAGQPLAGPHRDELELLWGGYEARRVSSAGERKLFGLLLTAARARVLAARRRPPLLLLDDLDAELDAERLRRVWQLFSEAPQVFASTTDAGLARRLGGLREWHLEGGVARSANDARSGDLNG